MTRVVLDTNVLVSALLKSKGNEAALLDLAAAGRIRLCVSEPVLAEYAEVLSRPRLRLDPERVLHVLGFAASDGILVAPTRTVGESPDEPDNRFLECAEAAQADYLVTGNARHFPKSRGATAVVNAKRLLELLR